jgi:hypothetical protein
MRKHQSVDNRQRHQNRDAACRQKSDLDDWVVGERKLT